MKNLFIDNIEKILCTILFLCGIGLIIQYFFFNGTNGTLGKGLAFVVEAIFFYVCIRKGKL